MQREPVTANRLRKLLDYNPDTGIFVWKLATTNRVKAGDAAGSRGSDGYIRIGVCGRIYKAHRLAWLYVHGDWPKMELDHINGIKTDNRIGNLRDVTRSVNARNLHRAQRNSASGVLGVSLHKATGLWRAYKHRRYLGYFKTVDAAKAAWDAA